MRTPRPPRWSRDQVRGWHIHEDMGAPVTGRWRAIRYGVGMCAADRPALLRMIEARV